jgi:hypothetical protein
MNERSNLSRMDKLLMRGALFLATSGLLLTPSGAFAGTSPHPPGVVKPTIPTPAKPAPAPAKPAPTEARAPAPAPTAPAAESGSQSWRVVAPASLAGDDFDVLNSTYAASSSEAWAVGEQRSESSEAFVSLFEEWTGSEWKAVPGAALGSSSTGSSLYAVSGTGPSNVWAVGGNSTSSSATGLIEHWNGTSWSALAPTSREPANSTLAAVSADSATDVWAVGESAVSEPHTTGKQPLIEHYNGSSWSVVQGAFTGNENDTLIAVEAVSPSDVWALGVARPRNYSGAGTSVLEHYNGTEWSIVSAAETSVATHLHAITGLSADDLWAVGEEGSSPVIEHFNGSTWSAIASPATVEGKGGLLSVTELSPSDVWAVGRGVTEHYNGTNTNIVASASEEASLEARVESVSGITDGPLFAVGSEHGGNAALILQQPAP